MVSQSIDYLIDLEAKFNYCSGTSVYDDYHYSITSSSLGLVMHNFFGSKNPYIGMGMGYYRFKDIWELPGINERVSGNIMLAIRGNIGRVDSPVDLDLRFDWHLFPKVPTRYLIYYYPSEEVLPHKTEYRRIYGSAMTYFCISLGVHFKAF